MKTVFLLGYALVVRRAQSAPTETNVTSSALSAIIRNALIFFGGVTQRVTQRLHGLSSIICVGKF